MMPRIVTPSSVVAETRSSTPSDAHRARVLHLEVAADEDLGVGVELGPLLLGEVELANSASASSSRRARCEILERGLEGAFLGRAPHQVLEREVDERALAGGRRRRLGQPLQVGEPERERAARERAHRAGRQGVGRVDDGPRAAAPPLHVRVQLDIHTATIQPPCDSFGHGCETRRR